MISCFACPCGVRGDEVEDAYADRATAKTLWNTARRRERAIAQSYADDIARREATC